MYQFIRGVQTGGAGPSIQWNWAVTQRRSEPIHRSQLDRDRLTNDSADL